MNNPQNNYFKNRVKRNIVLKARQLGFSTFECLDALDSALFNKNFNSVIIAHEKDALKTLFLKIKIAWDNLELRKAVDWQVSADSVNELRFGNGSRVRVALSTRGDTVNKLHVSEFGKICKKYPLKAMEIITGAFPSVPRDGLLSIESTAEGDYGLFHDLFWEYHEKEPKTNYDFKTFFYPWMSDKENEMEPMELNDNQIEYQRLHALTDRQASWYFTVEKTQKEKMKQENPTTPDEAFEATGEKIFNQEKIKELLANSCDGVSIGDWRYYSEHIAGHNYALGADVSEGLGLDSSTCAIIDFAYRLKNYQIVPKLVGVYKNNRIPPDDFAYVIRDGGSKFGGCLVAPELNNSGHATVSKLKEIYRNIYFRERTDEITRQITKKLGWLTTGANKTTIIMNLKKAVENDELIIQDKGVLRELKSYDGDSLRRLQDDKEVSAHFDLVMAVAIAWEMKNYIALKIRPIVKTNIKNNYI